MAHNPAKTTYFNLVLLLFRLKIIHVTARTVTAIDAMYPTKLKERIPKATDKMLTQQLRELEKDGLIHRTVYPVVPPKTEYSLTDFGQTLAPILDAMCNWGTDYLKG